MGPFQAPTAKSIFGHILPWTSRLAISNPACCRILEMFLALVLCIYSSFHSIVLVSTVSALPGNLLEMCSPLFQAYRSERHSGDSAMGFHESKQSWCMPIADDWHSCLYISHTYSSCILYELLMLSKLRRNFRSTIFNHKWLYNRKRSK